MSLKCSTFVLYKLSNKFFKLLVMKKGFKFQFVVSAVVNGRRCYFHSVSFERALQEYFYYKNVCPGCISASLEDRFSNIVLREFLKNWIDVIY